MKELIISMLVLVLCHSRAVAEQSNPALADDPFSDWLEAPGITGDWRGVRDQLLGRGIDIFGSYTVEVWGNTAGGVKRGAVYTGLLDFGVEVDAEKLLGIPGLTFYNSWLWLSGRDASEDLAGNLLTISNIAGFNTFRLFELWAQQSLFDDFLVIRLGQFAADETFTPSEYGSVFLNATFGWPPFISLNLPGGGPGYPMAVPAVQIDLNPTDSLNLRTALFQGNPFDQDVNRHGFRYRFNAQTGWLWMNQATFSAEPFGMPGTYKAGAWFHTARFASVSNPEVTYPWDYGFYFVADQLIYREPSSQESLNASYKSTLTAKSAKSAAGDSGQSEQGLGWFGRIAFEPQNRNFLGWYFDTGLAYMGLLPGRDKDVIGFGIAYASLSQGSAQTLYDGGSRKVGYEMVLELTYQAAITPWLTVQPDIQAIIRPGGTQDVGNAFVLGLRATVNF